MAAKVLLKEVAEEKMKPDAAALDLMCMKHR